MRMPTRWFLQGLRPDGVFADFEWPEFLDSDDDLGLAAFASAVSIYLTERREEPKFDNTNIQEFIRTQKLYGYVRAAFDGLGATITQPEKFDGCQELDVLVSYQPPTGAKKDFVLEGERFLAFREAVQMCDGFYAGISFGSVDAGPIYEFSFVVSNVYF